MATTKTANEERLPRLLALVPYLQARPGIPVSQAAADFGVTEAQLRKDLTLLWMCGLPGHGPGDLIDLNFELYTVHPRKKIADARYYQPSIRTKDPSGIIQQLLVDLFAKR